MYIRTTKITANKIINGCIIAACALPILLIFLMFFYLFAYYDGTIASILAGSVLLTILSALIGLIIWRAMVNRKLSKARIYNSLIEEDHDGIISYETISSMTGSNQARIIRDLMWLRKHNYLINVTLGRSALRVDVKSEEHDFVTVLCPSCGNSLTIRKVGGGRCDYCGTFMRVKEDDNVQ